MIEPLVKQLDDRKQKIKKLRHEQKGKMVLVKKLRASFSVPK